jgi:hypothetical protein
MGRIRYLRLSRPLTEASGLNRQELAVLLGSGEEKAAGDGAHQPLPKEQARQTESAGHPSDQ